MAENGNGTPADGSGLAALQRLLEERTNAIRRIGAKLREARQQAKDATAARDQAVKDREAAAAEVEKARKDFDAAPQAAELERLKAELREGKHRDAFDRVAAEKGVAADAIDLVYRTSGYKPEGDAPDPDAIGKLLDSLRDQPGVSRLFGGESSPPPGTPPPGSGQGGRERGGSKFRVTTDQLADGPWCLRNAAAMRQAQQDGTFEVVAS